MAQPRVQRTRLRRGATLAVCKQRYVANNAFGKTRRAADALVGRIGREKRNARLCEAGLRRGEGQRGVVVPAGRGYDLGSRCGGRRGSLAFGAPAAAPEGGWRGGRGGRRLAKAAEGTRFVRPRCGSESRRAGRRRRRLAAKAAPVACAAAFRGVAMVGGSRGGSPAGEAKGSCAKAWPMLNWKQRKGQSLVPLPRAAVGRPRVPVAGLRWVGSDFWR